MDRELIEAERAALEAAMTWGQWRLETSHQASAAERELLARLDRLSRLLVDRAEQAADTERGGPPPLPSQA